MALATRFSCLVRNLRRMTGNKRPDSFLWGEGFHFPQYVQSLYSKDGWSEESFTCCILEGVLHAFTPGVGPFPYLICIWYPGNKRGVGHAWTHLVTFVQFILLTYPLLFLYLQREAGKSSKAHEMLVYLQAGSCQCQAGRRTLVPVGNYNRVPSTFTVRRNTPVVLGSWCCFVETSLLLMLPRATEMRSVT